MLKYLFYILHSCIFMLVTSNPLQGFTSFPVIQYQEDFGNKQTTFIQPTNLNSYPQGFMTQNHLTPNYNIPISYNDYVQSIYLNNALQNQLNSAINGNYDQNSIKIQHYELDPVDLLTPNVVNNYIIVPGETTLKNNTNNCNKKERRCKTGVHRKKTEIDSGDRKTNCKCKKRKDSKNTHRKAHENKEVRTINENQNDDLDNESNTKARKGCRKKSCRNKSNGPSMPKETVNVVDLNNQNSNRNNLKGVKKGIKYEDTENLPPDTRKLLRNDKNKSKNCRKVTKTDNCCDCARIQELDGCFNLNEDSINLENRCTRNDDSMKIRQQQYYNMPSDFSNNMAHYMMFNQQLFDTNRNFPTEFDYLYNMQQFPTFNTNSSQKPKNRQTNRTRNQKKCKKKNCDRNKKDPKQSGDYGEIVDLPPKLVALSTISKSPASVSTKLDESQIEKSIQDVPDNFREELKLNDDINVNDFNHEDFAPNFDDYYPEFHSDNFYTSKEEYDWNNFHDRHYYSSSDTNKVGRERRKYDNTDSIPIIQNDKSYVNLNPSDIIKIKIKENQEKDPIIVEVYQEETDSVKPTISSEEIQFRTPPALDFPDFKTKMINTDKNTPKAEIHYQSSKNTDNKICNNNNKMSAYSDVKNAETNEKINKIVDQNYVETVLGHSKVVKYGVQPNNQEIRSDTIIDSNCNNEEDENPRCNDDKPFIVIAKSLPYPM